MNMNKVCFNQNAFLIGITILTVIILFFRAPKVKAFIATSNLIAGE